MSYLPTQQYLTAPDTKIKHNCGENRLSEPNRLPACDQPIEIQPAGHVTKLEKSSQPNSSADFMSESCFMSSLSVA